MICYKKGDRLFFIFFFKNLVGVWEDLPTELRAHPPYLHPFSDVTLKEVVEAEEPVHWEALIEGKFDPEVPSVKEFS